MDISIEEDGVGTAAHLNAIQTKHKKPNKQQLKVLSCPNTKQWPGESASKADSQTMLSSSLHLQPVSPPRVKHLVLIIAVLYICLIIKSRTRLGSTGATQMMVIRAVFSEIRLGLHFFREENKLKIGLPLFYIKSYCLTRDTGGERRVVFLPGAGL